MFTSNYSCFCAIDSPPGTFLRVSMGHPNWAPILGVLIGLAARGKGHRGPLKARNSMPVAREGTHYCGLGIISWGREWTGGASSKASFAWVWAIELAFRKLNGIDVFLVKFYINGALIKRIMYISSNEVSIQNQLSTGRASNSLAYIHAQIL